MSNNTAFPIAFDRNSEAVVTVKDVPRGKSDGIVCIACNRPVLARKGNIRKWHFAHLPGVVNCAPESVLHKYAKQLLSESAGESIHLPKYATLAEFQDCEYCQRGICRLLCECCHDYDYHQPLLEVTQAQAETWIPKAGRRVDVLLKGNGLHFNKQPFNRLQNIAIGVEIAVTNFKRDDYQPALPTIEIDVSEWMKEENWYGLKDFVIQHGPRKWLTTGYVDYVDQRFETPYWMGKQGLLGPRYP